MAKRTLILTPWYFPHKVVSWQSAVTMMYLGKVVELATREDMYREHILDHYKHPRNFGVLSPASVDHEANNPLCGDAIRLIGCYGDNNRTNMLRIPSAGGRVECRAADIGCTSWNQLLLKFELSQPAVTCVIPGTSSPGHMRDNAGAGTGELPGMGRRA